MIWHQSWWRVVSRHGRVTSLLVAGQCPRFVQDNHHLKGFDWSQSLHLCNEDYSCDILLMRLRAATSCHLSLVQSSE